jgi:hypothetical protein
LQYMRCGRIKSRGSPGIPGTSHSDLLRVIGHPARAERDEAKSPEEIVRTGYVPRGIGEIGENGARQSS